MDDGLVNETRYVSGIRKDIKKGRNRMGSEDL
jgi:hypothetical protein